jgi:hypothetical protein
MGCGIQRRSPDWRLIDAGDKGAAKKRLRPVSRRVIMKP